MKFILKMVIFILSNSILLHAQTLDDIAQKSLNKAIPLFLEEYGDFNHLDKVRLIGLGDVADFAKESKKLNTAFASFLIEYKKFRNIFLPADDWVVRPINSYLSDDQPADSLRIESLVNTIFPNNYKFQNEEFKSFLYWIKKFNTSHQDNMVQITGVAPYVRVPASYFLSTYIYPLDDSSAKALSEKWTTNEPDDVTVSNDVHHWIETVKADGLSDEQHLLIKRCEADLQHNIYTMSLASLDQKFPAATLNTRSNYIARKMLEMLGKKGIFFSSNTDITITDYNSPLSKDENPINSIGGYLKSKLGSAYYALGVDYTGVAELPFVNMDLQSLEPKVIQSSINLLAINHKKDYLTRDTDSQILKGYKLVYMFPFFSLNTSTSTNNEILTVDGLFLLSNLTTITIDN